MDFIREIVSGPKNRFKCKDFNLDLTYITSRIIGMAFPASGFEKVFRNSIDEVAEFLEDRHKNNYMVINVSTRKIDETKLQNVHSFFWEDHMSPRFPLLFEISELVSKYLSQDEKRVAAIHCNHGKGRTGTLICCFLLFMGAMQSAEEAMQFYAKKRFEVEGKGVTQPCQRLYIKYFRETVINWERLYPRPLTLHKITIKGASKLHKLYIKVKNVITNSYLINSHRKESNHLEIEKEEEYTIKFNEENCTLAGDIVIEIKHESKVGNNLAAMYMFNTAFVEPHKYFFSYPALSLEGWKICLLFLLSNPANLIKSSNYKLILRSFVPALVMKRA